jgi:hypothetical protein
MKTFTAQQFQALRPGAIFQLVEKPGVHNLPADDLYMKGTTIIHENGKFDVAFINLTRTTFVDDDLNKREDENKRLRWPLQFIPDVSKHMYFKVWSLQDVQDLVGMMKPSNHPHSPFIES